jgi:1,4-alpha-glucan branching enzyme
VAPTATPFVEAALLAKSDVKFAVKAPDNTPPGTQVWLLVMAFTDWEWAQHIPMKRNDDGTWSATASLEEGALAHYAYDIWDGKEWSEFKQKREAATTNVPVDRRLLYVSEKVLKSA